MMSSEKQQAMTSQVAGPCPDCGAKHMTMGTKDAKSPPFNWITCSGDGCSYAEALVDFRLEVRDIRRAKRGLPPLSP